MDFQLCKKQISLLNKIIYNQLLTMYFVILTLKILTSDEQDTQLDSDVVRRNP